MYNYTITQINIVFNEQLITALSCYLVNAHLRSSVRCKAIVAASVDRPVASHWSNTRCSGDVWVRVGPVTVIDRSMNGKKEEKSFH